MRGVPSFYIWTQTPTADEVIEKIGITPDDCWSLGEPIDPKHPKYKTRHQETMLQFEGTFPENEAGRYIESIHAILDRLEPAKDRLIALKDQCQDEGIELKYQIGFFDFIPVASVAWMEFGIAELKRIASFGASFNCELVWGSDSSDPGVVWEAEIDRGFSYAYEWLSNHGMNPEDIEPGPTDGEQSS